MIFQKKKGSLEHKQYIILKLLSCKRKKENSELSHYSSCPMHLHWNSPIEIGFKQLPTSFLHCHQLPVMKLLALRSHKMSQLLPYSYFIHTCIYTPGPLASLVRDSDT